MNARVPEKKIDSIRIDTGAKRIEVNDEGEYITLNFADQSLPTRFFAMADEFQAKEPEYHAKAEAIDANTDLTEYERMRATAQLNLEFHTYFKEQIDALFGANTCRKVFGDIVPGVELYGDFLTQITPYFEKYGKERAKKLQKKYNPARKGNV